MTEKAKKDILEYLQCMVNTETPTPPKIVNDMLDLIPESVWLDDNAKILCPACKDGIFLREASLRILRKKYEMMGPTEFRKHQDEITDHILRNRMFGIAISYRGYRVTKRSLYTCSDKYSNIDNIFFDESLGRYVKDKDGKEVEKQCFHFIENIDKVSKFFEGKGVKDMQFDVIIGNPPYQESDGGGTGDSAKPIYNKFIQQAKTLNPAYICMIVPSRWMKGGKGLDSFREEMINDTRISHIVDYANASECFPLIHLDGGVCYFLWNNLHNNELSYTYHTLDGESFTTERYLKNEVSDTVIRDIRQLSIIKKTADKKETKFSNIVSARKPYGIGADFFNFPDRYPDIKQQTEKTVNSLTVYGVKGKKGGARRTTSFIEKEAIKKNTHSFDKYKLFFSKAYMATATVPPKIIIGKPGEICTETFLEIGPFNTELEAINCLKYIQTKFYRALLFYSRHSLNISQDSFSLIPLLDFNKGWTDKELYQKYELTQSEIDFIEQQIKPMDNDSASADIDTDDE